MTESLYLKIACKGCGNHIEFPADGGGATVECPHCKAAVELPAVSVERKKSDAIYWVLMVFLIAASGGAFWWKHFGHSQVEPMAAVVPTNSAKAPATGNGTRKTNVNDATNIAGNSANMVADETNSTNEIPQPKVKRPKSAADLQVGKIKLEKTAGSKLVYAVGTMKNESDYQHFGVRVTLDLLDAKGLKIGSAQDYIGIIEPHKNWKFRAMVIDPKTTQAALASVKEESD